MDLPLGAVLGPSASSAAVHLPARPRTRVDADGRAPRRVPGAAKRAGLSARSPREAGRRVCTRERRHEAGHRHAVVETAEQLLDQRQLDADALAECWQMAKEATDRFAAEEDIEVEWERIWSIEPILSTRADRLGRRGDPRGRRDLAPAAERPAARRRRGVARGIPTVMLFVQSLRGLSHTKIEDTKPEHLS